MELYRFIDGTPMRRGEDGRCKKTDECDASNHFYAILPLHGHSLKMRVRVKMGYEFILYCRTPHPFLILYTAQPGWSTLRVSTEHHLSASARLSRMLSFTPIQSSSGKHRRAGHQVRIVEKEAPDLT
jgi:hypothetical protein